MIVHALLFATAIRVHAIQHRGWWELRYSDGTVAANELHIPAGQATPVRITTDAPRFSWEMSFKSSTTLSALHGAKLYIVADDHFDQWLANQRRNATAAGPGRDVFLTARCTLCHTVRGVAVAEQPIGPDLTHFASRSTIAGTVPNRIGFLAGWIADSERIKPDNGMPINNVKSTDQQALLAFLRMLR